MIREFPCSARRRCRPGHSRRQQTATPRRQPASAHGVQCGLMSEARSGDYFVRPVSRSALSGADFARSAEGGEPRLRRHASSVSGPLLPPVRGSASSRATRHRHKAPSCCTCARAMLAKPRFWGCRYPSCRPEIEVPFEFQGLGSLGAARGDGFSLANLTA
jgi:hypothetical protein